MSHANALSDRQLYVVDVGERRALAGPETAMPWCDFAPQVMRKWDVFYTCSAHDGTFWECSDYNQVTKYVKDRSGCIIYRPVLRGHVLTIYGSCWFTLVHQQLIFRTTVRKWNSAGVYLALRSDCSSLRSLLTGDHNVYSGLTQHSHILLKVCDSRRILCFMLRSHGSDT